MEIKSQLPACISRIVLVGFMGAGKSTVGALLARRLEWKFIDADAVIEDRARKSIADIFADRGEPAFRALEAAVVTDLVREERLVLALGGGAVETPAIRKSLLTTPETCVVFLHAPLETMIARCEQQPGAALRPVLTDRARLSKRFESRLPHYHAAHLVIETGSLTPEQTMEHIHQTVSFLLKENAPA